MAPGLRARISIECLRQHFDSEAKGTTAAVRVLSARMPHRTCASVRDRCRCRNSQMKRTCIIEILNEILSDPKFGVPKHRQALAGSESGGNVRRRRRDIR